MATKVHSTRLYNLASVGVKCMSFERNVELLAVGRSDNSIEVWNLSCSPYIERTILGSYRTVEGLAWSNKRLFCVTSSGFIVEYDLFLQSPKALYPLSNGAGLCVAVCPEKKFIAAGTEDGFINLFNIMDNELAYNKLLDKQEGGILCLVWDSSGDHIVTGSVDTVRVWNVSSGHAIHRMMTGRAMNNKETIVWSVVVTLDFTIISGDSRGKLCFWDGNSGTSLTSCQSHKADILAVCLSEDENTVYCAGVDPLIATYERVKVRGSDMRGKWVKSIQRVIHDHDVKSLIVCKGKLFSSGIDGYLAVSSYPPKMLVKYPPLLKPPAICIARDSKCLLFRYPTALLVWSLQKKQPRKVIEWRSCRDSRIQAAAISNDGCWLACSQPNFKLFAIENINEVPKLTRVQISTKKTLTANLLTFSDQSNFLAIATVDGKIHLVHLSTPVGITQSYHPHKEKLMTDSVSFIKFSSSGKYFAAADLDSNIIIWCQGIVHAHLPRYPQPITALNIQPDTDFLVVVYADRKLLEYSINKKKFTAFSKQIQNNQPNQWLTRNFPVHSISFDLRNKDIIMLIDDSTIFVINKQKELPNIDMKIPRLSCDINTNRLDLSESSNQHPINSSIKYAFNVIKKYKHLVHFGEINEGEMVAVEINPVTLTENLPINFKQKRFGRM